MQTDPIIPRWEKEIIVCADEREKNIVEIIMQKPPKCWGNFPTEIVVNKDCIITVNNKTIQLKERTPLSLEQDTIFDDNTKYIIFSTFIKYWLEDRV